MAHTATSKSADLAQTSADATETQWTSPSTHAPTATAVSTRPRSLNARTVSERDTGSAPPASWRYATRTPAPIPAQTGVTWLCSEQQTTGMPSSVSARFVDSSAWSTACWRGVYGSFITCAPSSPARPSPRVRFAWRTSKPPEPRPSSRAWTFTITSSPSSTSPVSRGYATQGTPSTSQRTSSGSRSTTAVTRPRLSDSAIEQRERDVHHRLDIGDGDVLIGRVDVRHRVRKRHTGDAALVEDIRVGAPSREGIRRREAAAFERLRRERDGRVVLPEAVASVRAVDLRVHLALLERRRERERLFHLAHDVGELRLVVAPRLGVEDAVLG